MFCYCRLEWSVKVSYANWLITLFKFSIIADFMSIVCMKVKGPQSCPTLSDPMVYTVHGILQAKILEWAAFPFSRGSSQPRDQTQVSHLAGGFFTSWATREALLLLSRFSPVRLCATPQMAAHNLKYHQPISSIRQGLTKDWQRVVETFFVKVR